MGSVSWQVSYLLLVVKINCYISGLHRAEVMQQPALCPWLWGTTPDLTLRLHYNQIIIFLNFKNIFQDKRIGSFWLSNWAKVERTILQEIWGTFLVFTGYNAYQERSWKGCLVPDILQRHNFQLHPIQVEIIHIFKHILYFICDILYLEMRQCWVWSMRRKNPILLKPRLKLSR